MTPRKDAAKNKGLSPWERISGTRGGNTTGQNLNRETLSWV